MRRIGIDFGTCNIKGAEKKKNGSVGSLKLGNRMDKPRIPNVIIYEKKKAGYHALIGDSALKKPVPEQDRVRNIKSSLQERGWKRELSFGKTVNAADVTQDIMKCLFEDIHNTNKEQEITVTITVPVNFSKRQQLMVEKAAEDAGFIVDSVISEPFASIFFLMQDYFDTPEEHHVLVFDFGGGTLDLCIASIREINKGKVVETQSTVGISYGGNDISNDIMKYIFAKRKPEQVEEALEKQENSYQEAINKYYLMEAIENLKLELFDGEDVDAEGAAEVLAIMYDSTTLDFGEISVKDIYDMLDGQNLGGRIFALLDKLFEECDALIASEITDIFMVGGTSSIPYFRNLLETYFEKGGHSDVESLFKLNDDMDFDERVYSSVALGAAIYQELHNDSDIIIKERIPFMVYTKDENGKVLTRLTKNDCFKDYSSSYAAITEGMRQCKKISVYQTIFGEEEKEVYLGDVTIDDNYADMVTLYRLMVDKKRDIVMEFGLLPPGETETLEDDIWIEGRETLQIEM